MKIERVKSKRPTGLGWQPDSYLLTTDDGITYAVHETWSKGDEVPYFVVFKQTSDPNAYGGHSVGVPLPDLDAALDWAMDDADEPWL